MSEHQSCSSGSERPLGWNDPDLPPPVKRGNQSEYVLAVYRESSKKIYSFACSYLNALPLQYEDACPKGAGCEGRGCDDGCPTTGWFWLTGEGDEAGTYQSLDMKPGDRIMGWRDLPQWGDAAQASGKPSGWPASLPPKREVQKLIDDFIAPDLDTEKAFATHRRSWMVQCLQALLTAYSVPSTQSAIPAGIYFSAEHDNFYSVKDNRGCGNVFYNEWRSRRHEFPHGPLVASTQSKTAED